MNTRLRLVLLLALLLAAFGAGMYGLRLAHQNEAERMLADLQRERRDLIERILGLTGQNLANFARDYSNWDEMLRYARQPDPAWAAVNIDASLPNFGADAAWVLGSDGALISLSARRDRETLQTLPALGPALLERLRREKFVHWFAATPAGLLELRGAPIQPSADTARTSEPQGWFVTGRLWDETHRELLQRVLESDVSVQPADVPHPADAEGVLLHRPLPGADNLTVAQLAVHYHPAVLGQMQETNVTETGVFYAFGLVVLGATLFALSRWVLRPLRQLERSLASGNAAPLERLVTQTDEFGRLARLTEAAFEQHGQLVRQIEERRRIEDALRHSTELRTRLARDVHDGLIQSLYAAGLGLEEVRRTLHADPVAAERRVGATLESLNRTIREVRSFIHDLEPEDGAQPGFAAALRTLAETLQGLYPIPLRIEIDPGAATELAPREELHALQIAREAISNAMRHSGASVVTLRVTPGPDRPRLEIADDGRGFDPAAATDGSGLKNLAARAREIGADLRIESSPRGGTCIILQLQSPTRP